MTKEEQFREITEEMYRLYCMKNRDYGDSFGKTFQELGIISAVTRLSDKMNRIKALAVNQQAKVSDERLEDTLMDLANYAIMTLIELRAEEVDDDAIADFYYHQANVW